MTKLKNSNFWTDERVAHLIKLLAEGHSTQSISAIFSKTYQTTVTKNAIVGKKYRIDQARQKEGKDPIKAPGLIPPIKKKSPKASDDGSPKKESAPKGVSIENIRSDQCQWADLNPEDPNFSFCGRPVVKGRLYCESHSQKAYANSRRKETN